MRIHLKDMTEMLQYTTENKDLIYKLIQKKIEQNISKNIKNIVLFEVYLTEYSMVITNELKRTEWNNSLQLALNYFEEIEDYDFCIKVRDTIKLLKESLLPSP